MAHQAGRIRKEDKDAFLASIAESGYITKAIKASGFSRNAWYLRRADPRHAEFAARWKDAHDAAIEELEDEARRRAFEGVYEDIYHNGEVVGSKQKHSDVLLIFLLKAARPDKYRENARFEHTGADGGPIKTRWEVAIVDAKNGDPEET